MDMDKYQIRVTKVKKYQDNPSLYLLAKLTEETGEVAKEIIRREEGRSKVRDLTLELGDILWVITAIAENYNIKLSDIIHGNLRKLRDRRLL